jgi:predicted site-specific integrase-resolvase
MEFVGSKEAMRILGIKSPTTLNEYERQGKFKVYRPFSNRKRYKVSELERVQSKG